LTAVKTSRRIAFASESLDFAFETKVLFCPSLS
jgi:hypothetical protein